MGPSLHFSGNTHFLDLSKEAVEISMAVFISALFQSASVPSSPASASVMTLHCQHGSSA